MFGTPTWSRLAPLLALLVLGVLLPQFAPQYFLYVGNLLMMYAVLAIGLDLLLGWAGQFAFAHIAFFGVGAYGTVLLQTRLGVPFVAAMPLSAILAGLVGMLIAFPAARLRAVYLALATFAFAEGAQWVFNAWDVVTGGADGLRIKAPELFGYALGTHGLGRARLCDAGKARRPGLLLDPEPQSEVLFVRRDRCRISVAPIAQGDA